MHPGISFVVKESELLEQTSGILKKLTNRTTFSLLCGRAETMFPTSTSRACEASLGARARAAPPMHPTTAIWHCRCSTLLALSRLGATSRGSIWISRRVAVLQPSRSASALSTAIIRLHCRHARISHCSGCCSGLLDRRLLVRLCGYERVLQPFSVHPCLDSVPELPFESQTYA